MTIRDELVRVIDEVTENAKWFDHGSPDESTGDRFLRDHGAALVEALRMADPVEHVRYLEEAEDTTDIAPRLQSYDATGRKDSVYVIWPGGESHYYIREDLTKQPVALGQYAACSICFGNGFDVAGKPCPFAPHKAFDNKGYRT